MMKSFVGKIYVQIMDETFHSNENWKKIEKNLKIKKYIYNFYWLFDTCQVWIGAKLDY